MVAERHSQERLGDRASASASSTQQIARGLCRLPLLTSQENSARAEQRDLPGLRLELPQIGERVLWAQGSRRHGDRPARIRVMPLSRIAWAVTVVISLFTSLMCLLSNYNGYAAVFLAVGVSAAINLL